MKVLVTGGAGYIGSVVTEYLVDQGRDVVVLDNLAYGHLAAVHPRARFEKGDILEREWLFEFLKQEQFDCVVHLAAESLVEKSMHEPAVFFRVNVTGGMNLLDAMVYAGTGRIIFSSTAATYGEPDEMPITEDTPKAPVNAYGHSKFMFEQLLPWYERAHGIRYVSLRYFNACGATDAYGEFRRKETHIIPLLFEVALGHREKFSLFGGDYPTPDGTCVRDYIHVYDIAAAHVLALDQLDATGSGTYNIGNGAGFSNLDVVRAVRTVTGHPVPLEIAPRRTGDPATLVASSERIRRVLGWQPRYPDLASMVATAWNWRRAYPNGYRGVVRAQTEGDTTSPGSES